jgi:hypothetical protein
VKARTFILTTGAALALVAPAAQAAHTSHTAHLTNGLGCAFAPPPLVLHGGISDGKPFYNPLNPRGLQAASTVRSAATSRPLHLICGGKKSATVVAANYFQILRDSL